MPKACTVKRARNSGRNAKGGVAHHSDGSPRYPALPTVTEQRRCSPCTSCCSARLRFWHEADSRQTPPFCPLPGGRADIGAYRYFSAERWRFDCQRPRCGCRRYTCVTGFSVQSPFRSAMTSLFCHDNHDEIAGGWSCRDLVAGILRQSRPASGARSRRLRPRILVTALRGNALLRAPAARSRRRAIRRIGGRSPAVNSSRNRSTHGEAATGSAHAPSNTACCHGTSAATGG